MTVDYRQEHLRQAFQPLIEKTDPEVQAAIRAAMKPWEEGDRVGLQIVCSRDYMKPAFLYALLARGELTRYELMNIYRLVDIYFDRDEEYKSVMQISVPILLLYGGYSEKEIANQQDFICQLMDAGKHRGQQVWFYYKGTVPGFKSMFPRVWEVELRLGYTVVEIPSVAQGEPVKGEVVESQAELYDR